jgi:hypothetical protein
MVIYCCTRKMINKIGHVEDSNIISDTILGDWYVDYLYERSGHLVLFTNENSLLPLLLPAVPISSIFERFSKSLENILQFLRIDRKFIDKEIILMNNYINIKTRNKRVLGSMTDYKNHIKFSNYQFNPTALFDFSCRLAEIPSGAMSYQFPSKVTKRLFTKQESPTSA